MNSRVENYLGWDFGPVSTVCVRSIKIKQFDTQYCAKTLAVQWSDDGHCWFDAWFVNASAVCPLNTSAVGGHAGVTTSPPSTEPAPSPVAPLRTASALNITVSLGGPLWAGRRVLQVLGVVQMTKGKPVLHEGMNTADGNAAGVCEYAGTLSLTGLPDDGVAHDLYLNFEAGANATYLLDSFWLRAEL
jgi:hypothetical protein